MTKNDQMLKDWKVTKEKGRRKYLEYNRNVHLIRKSFKIASNGIVIGIQRFYQKKRAKSNQD